MDLGDDIFKPKDWSNDWHHQVILITKDKYVMDTTYAGSMMHRPRPGLPTARLPMDQGGSTISPTNECLQRVNNQQSKKVMITST